MNKLNRISVRTSFSFNQFDVGMRNLYEELKHIEMNSNSAEDAANAQRFHLLNILRAYSQNKYTGTNQPLNFVSQSCNKHEIKARTINSVGDQTLDKNGLTVSPENMNESSSFINANPVFRPQ